MPRKLIDTFFFWILLFTLLDRSKKRTHRCWAYSTDWGESATIFLERNPCFCRVIRRENDLLRDRGYSQRFHGPALQLCANFWSKSATSCHPLQWKHWASPTAASQPSTTGNIRQHPQRRSFPILHPRKCPSSFGRICEKTWLIHSMYIASEVKNREIPLKM